MNKLLIICGPTATGKTQLALQLAKLFDGELISADSRQVYKFMDIVTGKDIPKNFRFKNSDLRFKNRSIPYFVDRKTRIWGYDVVHPDEEWSVKLFQDFANIVIADISKRGKLPIVVGGTGLYLKALTEPMPFVSVPRNLGLRKKLMNESSGELLQLLIKEWPERVVVMNKSDRKNPRRLIRAIEIAAFQKARPFRTEGSGLQGPRPHSFNTLWIGLVINNRQELYNRIDRRVDQRLTPQLWEELEFLKKKGFLQIAPNVTIGYRQLIPYLSREISKEESIQRWKFAEHDYARRQLVWFRKQPNIHWFDVTEPTYKNRVVMFIRQWYDDANASRRQSSLD